MSILAVLWTTKFSLTCLDIKGLSINSGGLTTLAENISVAIFKMDLSIPLIVVNKAGCMCDHEQQTNQSSSPNNSDVGLGIGHFYNSQCLARQIISDLKIFKKCKNFSHETLSKNKRKILNYLDHHSNMEMMERGDSSLSTASASDISSGPTVMYDLSYINPLPFPNHEKYERLLEKMENFKLEITSHKTPNKSEVFKTIFERIGGILGWNVISSSNTNAFENRWCNIYSLYAKSLGGASPIRVCGGKRANAALVLLCIMCRYLHVLLKHEHHERRFLSLTHLFMYPERNVDTPMLIPAYRCNEHIGTDSELAIWFYPKGTNEATIVTDYLAVCLLELVLSPYIHHAWKDKELFKQPNMGQNIIQFGQGLQKYTRDMNIMDDQAIFCPSALPLIRGIKDKCHPLVLYPRPTSFWNPLKQFDFRTLTPIPPSNVETIIVCGKKSDSAVAVQFPEIFSSSGVLFSDGMADAIKPSLCKECGVCESVLEAIQNSLKVRNELFDHQDHFISNSLNWFSRNKVLTHEVPIVAGFVTSTTQKQLLCVRKGDEEFIPEPNYIKAIVGVVASQLNKSALVAQTKDAVVNTLLFNVSTANAKSYLNNNILFELVKEHQNPFCMDSNARCSLRSHNVVFESSICTFGASPGVKLSYNKARGHTIKTVGQQQEDEEEDVPDETPEQQSWC